MKRLEPLISLFINNNEAEPRASSLEPSLIVMRLEARNVINCKNEMRGSSLSINNNEVKAFIIRGSSLLFH